MLQDLLQHVISEISTLGVGCIHAIHRVHENFTEFSLVQTCTEASHLCGHVSSHLVVFRKDVFKFHEVKEACVCLSQQLLHLCLLLCILVVFIKRKDVLDRQLFLNKVRKLTKEGLVHLVVQKRCSH